LALKGVKKKGSLTNYGGVFSYGAEKEASRNKGVKIVSFGKIVQEEFQPKNITGRKRRL